MTYNMLKKSVDKLIDPKYFKIVYLNAKRQYSGEKLRSVY